MITFTKYVFTGVKHMVSMYHVCNYTMLCRRDQGGNIYTFRGNLTCIHTWSTVDNSLQVEVVSTPHSTVAYPELVSRGVSKSRKCKWLVKVCASNGVTPLIKKYHGRGGGGGFPGNQKTPLDTPLFHRSSIRPSPVSRALRFWLAQCCLTQYLTCNQGVGGSSEPPPKILTPPSHLKLSTSVSDIVFQVCPSPVNLLRPSIGPTQHTSSGIF